ncbi:MAG TPA: hypothetical protein VK427_17620 [Kofleriaceae bacterium]|nr:hypothetical protein [Kofleriaceae bacterium]
MLAELLARIDAFAPADDGNWRALDELVQAVFAHDGDLFPALPTLLRVFERYPRHDGHGVFWAILHGIEHIRDYDAVLLDHVTRTPTELGITLLQRRLAAGFERIGAVPLRPLIQQLAPRAPVIDYSIAPVHTRVTRPHQAASALLDELARFRPARGDDVDWAPLLALVAKLLDTQDPAIVTPLLQTLDRFHTYDAFSPFWPIVNGLEQLPRWPSLLVAAQQAAPARFGTTLLLRLLARELYVVDGVDVAALAASQLADT